MSIDKKKEEKKNYSVHAKKWLGFIHYRKTFFIFQLQYVYLISS
jgi:uncharacterized protein involved in type VI secretion and phage assembly